MPRRAARDEAQPVETGELSIPEPQLGDPDVEPLGIHPFAHRVSHGLRLLEDLFEHEVGIAGLLRRLTVPGDGARLTPNRNPVERPQRDPFRGHRRQLSIVENEDLPRLPQQGRYVRRDEHLPLTEPDDQRGAP